MQMVAQRGHRHVPPGPRAVGNLIAEVNYKSTQSGSGCRESLPTEREWLLRQGNLIIT